MSTVTVKPSLTLKRRLNAAPEKVYSAWTEPEKVTRWFGPGQTRVTTAEFDRRAGGRWRFVAVTADGEEIEVGGTVREAVANAKLVYTWAWRSTPERVSLVTVEFKPDGTGTLLTLTHEDFFDDPARDRHQSGWNGALDELESYLA
jgi:uncharacterized protein YndB with AHSA1/START domain